MSLMKIQGFEFPAKGGAAKYDWDEILNGEVVVLTEGKDYDRDREAFKTSIRIKANGRGMGVHVVSFDAGDATSKKYKLKGKGLIVQAYPGTPEQVEEWNRQAAQRKASAHAKAKAKRAAKKAAAATTAAPATKDAEQAA